MEKRPRAQKLTFEASIPVSSALKAIMFAEAKEQALYIVAERF